MKLHEFQAKEVLAAFGVPVPKGFVCASADEVEKAYRVAKVEERRRFVEQQDARLLGEGSGEHGALALASG